MSARVKIVITVIAENICLPLGIAASRPNYIVKNMKKKIIQLTKLLSVPPYKNNNLKITT